MKYDYSAPIEIADSIFWVGIREKDTQFNCNPYLIRTPEVSVLVDAGSVIDFTEVRRKVETIIPLDSVKYIILQHQDPDLCASTPLFEKAGFNGQIVTHWRAALLIKHYGTVSPFYLVNEKGFRLSLPGGRELHFFHTPYLHFPGAIVTFDPATGTLFSSDLFGAFTLHKGIDNLFADESYMEAMKTFHEHYMPGNNLLRPVMEMLMRIDIQQIAPQHGCIIRSNIRQYIETLRDLECGSFIRPIQKQIAESGGYTGLCNFVLKRYHAIASVNEVALTFADSDIVVDAQTGLITDFSCSGRELWNMLFQIIYARHGSGWLTPVEILVKELSVQHNIEPPDIFSSALADISKQADQLDIKYHAARKRSEHLETALTQTQERLTHDEVTGLHNAVFFRNYLADLLLSKVSSQGSFLLISIDDLQTINFKYGNNQGTQVVKGIAVLLRSNAQTLSVFAKLEGALFGVYCPGQLKSDCILWADGFRGIVREFEGFIERITVSIGVVHTDECATLSDSAEKTMSKLFSFANARVRMAQKRGMDFVCADSAVTSLSVHAGRVLVADPERLSSDVLKTVLEHMDIEVMLAEDGEQAQKHIESNDFDLIISELLLPKTDGFLIREKMLLSSKLRAVPYIITSHLKNEASIQRAQTLEIAHYFKKPYFLSEVVGIVKKLLRGREQYV